MPLLFKLPIASRYDWCIAVASKNIITLLWFFSYWDQSLLFADPRKCCSVYHPLSPSKIFLRCRTTLKIRIFFLQDWISVVYSSFGYFHGDTREREAELTAQNNDSLSCETNQSQSRARRCDLWGRQCDQLLHSGDQIFTPGRLPGPQDRWLSSLGKRTLMIIRYPSEN